MKKLYLLLCVLFSLSFGLNAQIKQATDLSKDGDSGIADPYVFNGEIYFEAEADGDLGDELYRISADGTVSLFKDINTDPEDSSPNSDPGNFIEFNGKLYFNANDGDKTMYGKELWVTDGTAENTLMVMDIQTGIKGSNPQQMFVFNNKLYFQANDGTSTQWWVYDGTNDPVKVTDLNGGGFATPMNPIVDEANNMVYFQASNGKNELHVMKADETVEIIDINPSNHGYTGSQAILFNGKLLFQGDNGVNGDELWISDGTFAGTSMILDINAGDANSDPASFTELNGKVYFVADNGTGDQLFVTDGTTDGTLLVAEPNPGQDGGVDNLFAYNGSLYFSAVDSVKGEELWVFDGTAAKLLKDINTVGDAKPEGFIVVDGLLFFEATDSTGTKLWVSDGAEENTIAVAADFKTSADPLDINLGEVAVIGSKLYFTGDDANGDDIFVIDAKDVLSRSKQATDLSKDGDSGIADPYVFDGEIYFEAEADGDLGDELYRISADGTVSLFKDINTDPEDSSPNSDPGNFIEFNGKLYFNANDGDKTMYGKELWVTDGTAENTLMVMDIQTGIKGSNPQQMFVFNNKLYFQANDGTSTQWWVYDGTNDPVKVTDLNGGGFATPMNPIVDEANNMVYFQASNGKNELHVMKADETVEIIDINPSNHGYTGSQAILFNGKLLFQGDNGVNGDELWISDGTFAGTSMILDINAGDANSDPASFTELNGKVYFVADNGTGDQLFVTDGTTDGTLLVAEPNPGQDGGVDNLFAYNGSLYFSAVDSVKGEELWVFDGTAAKLLKDINTVGDAKPEGFIVVDGLLFFEATDSTGTKLWVSDGAEERTMKVAEALNTTTDPDAVNSAEFAVVGTKLYYTADDANGDEFFMVDASKLFSYDVTFTVTDEEGLVDGATVAFNGTEQLTNQLGQVQFFNVRMSDSLTYSVSAEDYITVDSFVVVANNVFQQVSLVADPNFDVIFTVSDKYSNSIAGAIVTFNGTSVTVGEAGTAVFTGVVPGTSADYSVSFDGYIAVDGSLLVDTDLAEEVMLILTSINDQMKSQLKVYPNPTTGMLYVDGNLDNKMYTVYDLNQRLVANGVIQNQNIRLNLIPGLYLLHINTETAVKVEKIIIK